MGDTSLVALDTASVDPTDRLDFWTSAVSQTYVDLDCSVPNGGRTIDGHIESAELGLLGLSRVAATPQHVVRTPAGISRTSDDYFLVSIQVAGTGVIMQDGRNATLHPGDFALYDSTRPYQLRFDEDFAQYVLMLPGDTLRTLVADANSLTACGVSGSKGAGRLLITMIESVIGDTEMGVASAEAVAHSVEYILVAGLSEVAGRDWATTYSADERLDQIKKAMILRLRDPDLSVAGLAAQLHVSISSIHRAFSAEKCTPGEWIWSRRLEGVRGDLANPTMRRYTIAHLAHSWGFADAAHFSRTFRGRFGCTPTQYRLRNGM